MILKGKATKFFCSLILLSSVLFPAFSVVHAGGLTCSPVEVINGGDIGPWPFGLEQPFPWRRIDGVWFAEMNGCRHYFVFKTTTNGRNVRRLKINQVDSVSCKSVAEGLGVQEEDNENVVSASMVSANGPIFLSVHVFKESDIRNIRSKTEQKQTATGAKNVTILSVQNLTDPERVVSNYRIYKVANELGDVCQGEK